MTEKKDIVRLFELIGAYPKLFFLFGLIIGAIYLNGYLSEYGIPFPLDFAVLPATLIVVGALSMWFAILGIAYICLAAILNFDIFSTGYLRVIHISKSGEFLPHAGNSFKFVVVTYLLPLIFTLVIIRFYDADNVATQVLWWSGCLIWAVLYSVLLSLNAFTSFRDRMFFSLKLTSHILFFRIVVAVASLQVFFAIILPRMKGINDLELLIILAIYLGFNAALIFPVPPKRLEALSDSTVVPIPDEVIQHSHGKVVYFVMCGLLLVTLLPPFSPYLAEIPLRQLNIGGGKHFVGVGGRQQCQSWPDFIIKDIGENKDKCTSNVGKMIFQLGDRAYAIFLNKDDKPILVSLNLEKSSVLRPIPEDSIFFNGNKNTK